MAAVLNMLQILGKTFNVELKKKNLPLF